MKRLFFWLIMLSVGTAWAATKCVELNYNATGASSTAERYSYDWTVVEKNGIELHGISVCSETAGANAFVTTADVLSTKSGGSCWCRLISPFASKWVYAYFSGDGGCWYVCNVLCADYAKNTYRFRSTMFNNRL